MEAFVSTFTGATAHRAKALKTCRFDSERRSTRQGFTPSMGPYDAFFRMLNDIKSKQSDAAPAGRPKKMEVANKHAVLGTPLDEDFGAKGLKVAMFGMGCFWGAEKKFWAKPGVYSTAVGYAGGKTPNPTYREVCSGNTGHAEVVRVIYDPSKTNYAALLDVFWANHDPTTPNRQGNDVGTQYRSVAYYADQEQKDMLLQTIERYNKVLKDKGYAEAVTEIQPWPEFYFAEDYHQQYLQKNPWGYCGLGGLDAYEPTVTKVEAKL